MFKELYKKLIQIIYFGVYWEMPDGLKKRVILSNLASITLAIILLAFNIIQTIYLEKYYVTITTSFLIVYLASIPIFNKAGFINFTRISLCIIMPLAFVFIVPYNQLINADDRNIAFYTVPRFTILAMLVLPATLLDSRKKLKNALGLSIIMFSLLFFEEIQGLFFGRNDVYEPLQKRLYFVKLASLASFVFLTLGFVFLRRVNQRFEKRISRLLRSEKDSNNELQEINLKLESSHAKNTELLNKLKDTNNSLVDSQADLQEAYEELQSAELLTRERAREIEIQKEEIEKNHKEIIEKNQLLADAQSNIKKTNEELKASNLSLEKMVNERTTKLKKTNEELILANHELDLFIYRASHDLRGPIASILGLSQIAQLEVDHEEQMSYLKILQDTANNANQILAKLLLVNVINQATEQSEIDFYQIIDIIQNDFGKKFSDLEITFETNIEKGLKLTSDMNLLLIVCERLIENSLAFRANIDKNPFIRLSFYRKDGKVVMEVEDNGIGIPLNFYHKIFSMFFRASEKSKGNGLGLYIARKAAEKLQSDITFDSKVDVGTKFYLILPEEEAPVS